MDKCCANCRYLIVINNDKLYAFCGKMSKLFYPFCEDTRKTCCEYHFVNAHDLKHFGDSVHQYTL